MHSIGDSKMWNTEQAVFNIRILSIHYYFKRRSNCCYLLEQHFQLLRILLTHEIIIMNLGMNIIQLCFLMWRFTIHYGPQSNIVYINGFQTEARERQDVFNDNSRGPQTLQGCLENFYIPTSDWITNSRFWLLVDSDKIQFKQQPFQDFGLAWFLSAHCCLKILLSFATTYLCETALSALTKMMTGYRWRVAVQSKLWTFLSKITPTIDN